jgi:EF hand domain-containing protein
VPSYFANQGAAAVTRHAITSFGPDFSRLHTFRVKNHAFCAFLEARSRSVLYDWMDAMAISGIGGGFSNVNVTPNAQEEAQKLMKQMDTDSDGKVTKQEFTAFSEKMKANGPRPPGADSGAASNGQRVRVSASADEMFAKADAGGDGSLSVEDLSAMIAEHLTHEAARGTHQRGIGGAGGPPAGDGGFGGDPPGHEATSSSNSGSPATSDPADTDDDGQVSAAEKLAHLMSQSNVGDASEP